MKDNLQQVLSTFSQNRSTQPRDGRFPNWLRAKVVETNDPLNMGRIRFRAPELHDKGLDPKLCPWAEPARDMGGQNAGDWASPVIGDTIFVCFEKGDARAPIYTSAADPTLRRSYPLESIHTRTPAFLDENGAIADGDNPPNDFDGDYLPKDRRPMSRGWKDKYGNFIAMFSIGYVPPSHKVRPAPTEIDPINSTAINADPAPESNNPDYKMIVMSSKLGHHMIISDVGYNWEEEFSGNFEEDVDFEVDRSKYLRKLYSEDEAAGSDQRRLSFRTRAGHYFEMRDVGWNKTRAGELSEDSKTISESGKDERWIKLVSKGGNGLQIIDVGSDAENDELYKKNVIEDIGEWHDEGEWKEDKRQIRIFTRHGFKFVLDDRGSSKTNGQSISPHGNGLLIKGRRSSFKGATSSGSDSRGYFIEFNEKDEIDALKIGSPNDQVIEINDKFGFISICTQLPHNVNRPWQGLKNNEFSLASSRMGQAAELETFHLILDKTNQFSRFKTPKAQGLEMRDEQRLVDLRDEQDRGILLSQNKRFAVMRSINDMNAFVMIDDGNNQVLVQNNNGRIQISAIGAVEIISDTAINMSAPQINLRARDAIKFTASGISGQIGSGKLGVDGDIHAANVRAFIPEADRPAAVAGKGVAKPEPIGGRTPNISKVEISREELSPRQDTEELGLAPNMPTTPVDESVVDGE